MKAILCAIVLMASFSVASEIFVGDEELEEEMGVEFLEVDLGTYEDEGELGISNSAEMNVECMNFEENTYEVKREGRYISGKKCGQYRYGECNEASERYILCSSTEECAQNDPPILTTEDCAREVSKLSNDDGVCSPFGIFYSNLCSADLKKSKVKPMCGCQTKNNQNGKYYRSKSGNNVFQIKSRVDLEIENGCKEYFKNDEEKSCYFDENNSYKTKECGKYISGGKSCGNRYPRDKKYGICNENHVRYRICKSVSTKKDACVRNDPPIKTVEDCAQVVQKLVLEGVCHSSGAFFTNLCGDTAKSHCTCQSASFDENSEVKFYTSKSGNTIYTLKPVLMEIATNYGGLTLDQFNKNIDSFAKGMAMTLHLDSNRVKLESVTQSIDSKLNLERRLLSGPSIYTTWGVNMGGLNSEEIKKTENTANDSSFNSNLKSNTESSTNLNIQSLSSEVQSTPETKKKCVAAPTLYRKDSFCGSYTYKAVTRSWTAETNTPAKCQAVVEKECQYKQYFTWRKSGFACHCVTIDNCDRPAYNKGLTIYKVANKCPTIVTPQPTAQLTPQPTAQPTAKITEAPEVVEIDPCEANNGDCDENATCSFESETKLCKCKSGYKRDGKTCSKAMNCWTYTEIAKDVTCDKSEQLNLKASFKGLNDCYNVCKKELNCKYFSYFMKKRNGECDYCKSEPRQKIGTGFQTLAYQMGC